MTLLEFLEYFDFEYRLYDDGSEKWIGLIDTQNANLGGIEEERFPNDEFGVEMILDRLDIYYEDYIFNDLQWIFEHECNIDTSTMTWLDMYQKAKELNLNSYTKILKYIFEGKRLVLDNEGIEVVKEYDTYNIQFNVNGKFDETQFDVMKNEDKDVTLMNLFMDFCKENGFSNVEVLTIEKVKE